MSGLSPFPGRLGAFLDLCRADHAEQSLRAAVQFGFHAKRSGGGRRPSGGRGRRSDTPFVKVTGKLARFLGIKPSAGRYIDRASHDALETARGVWESATDAADDALDAARKLERDAARTLRDAMRERTISNRQRATQSLRNRTGEPTITREQYEKLIESGERQYTNETTAKRQETIKARRDIVKELPDVEPEEIDVMLKVRKAGDTSTLTDEEKEIFKDVFVKRKEQTREIRKIVSPKKRHYHRRTRNNARTDRRNYPYTRPVRKRKRA
jgi:hypothetical protein